jgi:hypothetical protein
MEAALQGVVRALLLLSVIVSTFVVPPMMLRRDEPLRVARVWRVMVGVVLVYVFGLIVIYPRLP